MMKNIKIISIVVAVVFLLIVIVSGILAAGAKKPLEIYNLDQVESGLSTDEVTELERSLWEDLRGTYGFSEDTAGVKALVRPSSWVKYDENGVRHYNFLVDVDEYQMTLEVTFALNGEGFYEVPLIECPRPEMMKYPGGRCKSSKTTTESVTVGRELPYYFNLESGELVIVTLKQEADKSYLNVRVSWCGDEGVRMRAKAAVEAWLAGLGYETGAYEIKVPEFCDGAAS